MPDLFCILNKIVKKYEKEVKTSMSRYKIQHKHISPRLSLLLPTEYSFAEMSQSAQLFESIMLHNESDTLICLLSQEESMLEGKFQICFPVKEADYIEYDQSTFYILPRVEVYSTKHKGTQENINKAIMALQKQFTTTNIRPALPYRIVYQKNSAFFRKNQQYTTEVQIPFWKDDTV